MKQFVFLLISLSLPLIFSLCSCSALKEKLVRKADSASTRQSSASERKTVSSTSRQQRLLLVTDSSNHQYTAEIIPAGPFHYSPKEGFTGTASRILITGRLSDGSTRRDSSGSVSTLAAQTNTASAEQQQAQVTRSEKTKEVKRGGSWWLWMVLAGALAGGGYVIKNLIFHS